MSRLLKHKLVNLYTVVILLLGLIGSTAFQAHTVQAGATVLPDGCYSSTSSTTPLPNSDCSGATDTSGQAVDPTQNCYVQEPETSASGVSGSTGYNYELVSCNDLTDSLSTTAPQDPCANGQNSGCVDGCSSSTNTTSSICNSIITRYINPIIYFLAAGVGIIVVIMVVIGAIQYITSGGNPQAVGDAKKRIANALLALVAFALMYALLNWLVPGGVL